MLPWHKKDQGTALGMVLIFITVLGVWLGSTLLLTTVANGGAGGLSIQNCNSNQIASATANVMQQLAADPSIASASLSSATQPNGGVPTSFATTCGTVKVFVTTVNTDSLTKCTLSTSSTASVTNTTTNPSAPVVQNTGGTSTTCPDGGGGGGGTNNNCPTGQTCITNGYGYAITFDNQLPSIFHKTYSDSSTSTISRVAVATGGVVTITTSSAHTYSPGDTITVSAATNTTVNGTFQIVTTPSSTTFTYDTFDSTIPTVVATADSGSVAGTYVTAALPALSSMSSNMKYSCLFSGSYHPFLGWNTLANGTGTNYADATTVDLTDAALGLAAGDTWSPTLYAQWGACVPDAPVISGIASNSDTQLTITFSIPNGNGSTVSSYTFTQRSSKSGTTTYANVTDAGSANLTCGANTCTYKISGLLKTDSGYSFTVIATNSQGNSAESNQSGCLIPTGNTGKSCTTTPPASSFPYSVSYYANSYTCANGETPITAAAGDSGTGTSVTLRSLTPSYNTSGTNYSFAGWSTTCGDGTVEYAGNATVTLTDNTWSAKKLYAVWTLGSNGGDKPPVTTCSDLDNPILVHKGKHGRWYIAALNALFKKGVIRTFNSHGHYVDIDCSKDGNWKGKGDRCNANKHHDIEISFEKGGHYFESEDQLDIKKNDSDVGQTIHIDNDANDSKANFSGCGNGAKMVSCTYKNLPSSNGNWDGVTLTFGGSTGIKNEDGDFSLCGPNVTSGPKFVLVSLGSKKVSDCKKLFPTTYATSCPAVHDGSVPIYDAAAAATSAVWGTVYSDDSSVKIAQSSTNQHQVLGGIQSNTATVSCSAASKCGFYVNSGNTTGRVLKLTLITSTGVKSEHLIYINDGSGLTPGSKFSVTNQGS